MANNNQTYHTLADIQARKGELRNAIDKKGELIGTLWNGLFTPSKANTRGELVANLISNGITAFDTFMLVRKLMGKYGGLFKGRKKR